MFTVLRYLIKTLIPAGVLSILGILSPAMALAEDWVYTVKDGDTLWSIAGQYLKDLELWRKVQTLNQVGDPLHIPPGTRLRIPAQWLRDVPFLAKVQSLNGQVEVLEDGREPPKPLAPGSWLLVGDTVTTGSEANATLEFVDGSKLLLQGGSRLSLDKIGVFSATGMTDTQLRLSRGRLETRVAPRQGPATRFEISTPGAVTSVRGTDYRVESDDAQGESRAEVLGGEVNFSSSGTTRALPAGYGSLAAAHLPPLPPVRLLPRPDVSGLPAEFDRVPVSVAIPALEGARAYRLQIGGSPAFDRLLFDRSLPAGTLRGPDLPDGEYDLRLRGIDGHGLEGENASFHFILNARPDSPFPMDPKPDAGVAEDTPAFSWSQVEGIAHYHLQIARDLKFTRVVADLPDVPDHRLTLGGKLPLGTYFWRVASIDPREGRGPYSDPQTFRRVPPAPRAEEPDFQDETMDIRWRAGTAGQSYQFQMGEDREFSKLLLDRRTEEPKLSMPKPDPGTYYLRIRTIDADGFLGPYGSPQEIDVPHSPYWWLLLLPLFALAAI
jgi:hypothetical protein